MNSEEERAREKGERTFIYSFTHTVIEREKENCTADTAANQSEERAKRKVTDEH